MRELGNCQFLSRSTVQIVCGYLSTVADTN